MTGPSTSGVTAPEVHISAAAPTAVAIHPCARCATVQRTCCQRAEILVTLGDVRRIHEHTAQLDFFEHRAPLDPSYTAFDEDDPNWVRLTVRPDGTRRMLKRDGSGDCTFLGEAGCVLPTEVRPIVCRLYPFAYDESGVTAVESEYCPTKLLAPDGRSMSDVLDIRLEDAQRWHATLYAELHADSLTTPQAVIQGARHAAQNGTQHGNVLATLHGTLHATLNATQHAASPSPLLSAPNEELRHAPA